MDKPPLLLIIFIIILGFTHLQLKNVLEAEQMSLDDTKVISLNDCVVKGYAHNWQQIYDIQKCESRYNTEVCNAEFGCTSGMGLWQIIPSTLKYCEEKLERDLNPFDATDNNDCGLWLLTNEGDYHWNMSKHCWQSD